MDVSDLRFAEAFRAIYETRNLTRAAVTIGRTQPAVSYQLRQLETAVGARLFERGHDGMHPTALADRLHALLGQLAVDLDRLRGLEDTDRPIVLASVSVFGRHVVAPVLRTPRFAAHRFVLHFPVADEVIARVRRGEADVGFVFRAVSHPRLVTEAVYEESYILIASPTWAKRVRSTGFEDLPFVTYDEGDFVMGRWIGHHFGRRPPRWHRSDHFEELDEVVEAVVAGRGVAVVPALAVRDRRVREVAMRRSRLLNTVYAVRRAGEPRPPVRALLDAIIA